MTKTAVGLVDPDDDDDGDVEFQMSHVGAVTTEAGGVSGTAILGGTVDRLSFATPDRELYLDTAKRIVHGARNQEYGHPSDDMKRLAALWSALLGIEISPKQCCQLLIALKLSRLTHSIDHEDSWVDIAGYVCVADRVQRRMDGVE